MILSSFGTAAAVAGFVPLFPSIAAPRFSPINQPQSLNSGIALSPVKITFDDIDHEVMFGKSFVVCFVLGANPPLHVIEGFAHRIWKDQSIDKIGMVSKGIFLVCFHNFDDVVAACNMNGILFDKKPFILKPWTKNMSYDRSDLSSIPI